MSQETPKEQSEQYFLDHDGYFRKTFEMRRIAKAFLKKALPSETLEHLDMECLSIEKRHLSDALFKDLVSDVVYRVPIKNADIKKHVDFFIVLEHKSYQDYLTIFQIWSYIFLICRSIIMDLPKAVRSAPDYRLPPIIAIILHHGESRFQGKTELSDFFFSLPGLGAFLPKLRAILFDLSEISDDDPILNDPETPELRVVLMVLKIIFRNDILPTLQEVMRELEPHTHDPQTRELIRATFIYLTSKMKYREKNYEQLLATFEKTIGEKITMPTIIEHWIAEGRAEERVKERANSVLRLLSRRWSVSESLSERVHEIKDLEVLDQLFDLALDCDSLDEFTGHLPEPKESEIK